LRSVHGRDSVPARTRYAVVAVSPEGPALLAVAPETGRTHQIRVHAAHAGAPLVGDRVYGGPARVTLASGCVVAPRRIALHAARVVVPDSRGRPWVVVSEIPEELLALGLALGLGRAEWDGAVSCELPS
jgi:23S rRNA pseudouridine955/2504/2580 synthase/23S rRNA pseudouridine1911/1915/1917 synthase